MVCASGVKQGATPTLLMPLIAPCVQKADSLRLLEPQHVMNVHQVRKPVTKVHKDAILVSRVRTQTNLQAHHAHLAKLEHSQMRRGQLPAKTVVQVTQPRTSQPEVHLIAYAQEASICQLKMSALTVWKALLVQTAGLAIGRPKVALQF
mmetsp:Transcript_77814/g.134841  ORF Transcript_77814/g.134841 Transcript_77814/m.134841 type:complete len:149 (+) Transcript_77814:95-541(+)